MGDLAGGLGGLLGGGGNTLGGISGLGASGLGNADPFSALFGTGGGSSGFGGGDLSGGDMWGGIFGGGTTSSDAASYALNQPGQDMWNPNQPGAQTGTPAQDQSAVQAAEQQVAQNAQAAMRQPAPSLQEAYGVESPFTSGGSTSPGAGGQGPQGWQVAGPPHSPYPPPQGGMTNLAPQHAVPDVFQSPRGQALPGTVYGGDRSYASQGTFGLPSTGEDPINTQRGINVGGLPDWTTPQATQQLPPATGQNGTFNPFPNPAQSADQTPLPQPRPTDAPGPVYDQGAILNPDQSVSEGTDKGFTGQDPVPLPRARPPGANVAATPPRATPPATADPAASVPNQPGSTASSNPPSSTQAGAGGGPQNPIQAIMQALGIQNMPQGLQQLIMNFLRQIQGVGMRPGMGMQPYGGGQGMAVDPRTGGPPVDPRTGKPFPLGTRWDQIPWSKGWDPSKQKQGVPWTGWRDIPDQGRSPSESGAPTADGKGIPPFNPRDPREYQYNPKTKRWGPYGRKQPPPGINLPPEKTAQLSPDQVPPSLGPRMTPKEQQREQEDLQRDPRTMSPEQMKKLRDLLKKRQDEGRRMIGRAGKGKTDIRPTVPGQPPYPRHDYTEPDMSIRGRNAPSWTGDRNANQPVINRPPPLPWGSNQPSYFPSLGVEGLPPYGRMIAPGLIPPGPDDNATYITYPDQFRGM